MHKRAKTANHLWIMLNVMVFWSQFDIWKHLLHRQVLYHILCENCGQNYVHQVFQIHQDLPRFVFCRDHSANNGGKKPYQCQIFMTIASNVLPSEGGFGNRLRTINFVSILKRKLQDSLIQLFQEEILFFLSALVNTELTPLVPHLLRSHAGCLEEIHLWYESTPYAVQNNKLYTIILHNIAIFSVSAQLVMTFLCPQLKCCCLTSLNFIL